MDIPLYTRVADHATVCPAAVWPDTQVLPSVVFRPNWPPDNSGDVALTGVVTCWYHVVPWYNATYELHIYWGPYTYDVNWETRELLCIYYWYILCYMFWLWHLRFSITLVPGTGSLAFTITLVPDPASLLWSHFLQLVHLQVISWAQDTLYCSINIDYHVWMSH